MLYTDVGTYDCITIAAAVMALAASSPSQLWFRCSIEMSDSTKRKKELLRQETSERKYGDKKKRKNKRSDVGHVDRRRTNSDRSCSTERRKRLASMAIVLDVRARERERCRWSSRSNEQEEKKCNEESLESSYRPREKSMRAKIREETDV